MKGLAGKQIRGLQTGSRLLCTDNTGAREVEIVNVINYHGVHRRYPKAGIGDIVVVSVKKGKAELRTQLINAVIVRQKRAFRRADGVMVQFEDNACVLTTPDGETKGSAIKGPVAREAADRWPRIASIATMIM